MMKVITRDEAAVHGAPENKPTGAFQSGVNSRVLEYCEYSLGKLLYTPLLPPGSSLFMPITPDFAQDLRLVVLASAT